MKHYGYRYTNSLLMAGPEPAYCAKDFRRMWPSGKLPSPLSRRILGIVTVTNKAQAKTLFCDICKKPLVTC